MGVILKTIEIAISCIFLIILTVLTLPWRYCVFSFAKCFRPDLISFATGITRLFSTRTKSGDILPINTIIVFTLEGYLNLETFRNFFIQRILQKRDHRGRLIYGKFYETIEFFLGYAFWRKENNFDIKNHIDCYDYSLDGISHFDETHLKAYLTHIMSKPWDVERSLWNFTLVHNYNGNSQTLLIITWQHALADGLSMKRALEELMIFKVNRTPPSEIKYPSKLKWFFKTLKSVLLFPYEAALFKARSNAHEIKIWEKQSNAREDEYYFTFTKPFAVDAIRSVRTKFSLGFQTVLFTAVSTALEKSLKECGVQTTKMLLSDYPKPLIPNTQGLTNSFFFGHICAPFMGTLTQDRLRVTEEGFRTHRTSNMSLGLHFLVEIGTLLPGSLPWVCKSLVAQFVHMIFTSIPTREEATMNDIPLSDLVTVFGSPHPSADFIATVTGVANRVRIGLSLRKNITSLPSGTVETIRERVEEEMEHYFKISA